jgi:addiction module RelE/StbE family toxin
MNIIWSEQARRDLRAIYDFIGRDSPHYAVLQVERLVCRVEKASNMPSRGHPVHEYTASGLREVHEGNYRIIYRSRPRKFFSVKVADDFL